MISPANTLFVLPAETAKPTARERGRVWHRNSQFPCAEDFRRIDRNDRFRIWTAAQSFERRTHTRGKHGGALGHSGIAVLRCLLFDFLNIASGRLDPTYEAIAAATNLARSVVIEAVKRLERFGILEITRRIVRERIKQWCEFARRTIWIDRTRQTSNAYRMNFPLTDRQKFGDLGMPLLKASLSNARAESGNRTETTPLYKSKNETVDLDSIADEGLRTALTRLKAVMEQ